MPDSFRLGHEPRPFAIGLLISAMAREPPGTCGVTICREGPTDSRQVRARWAGRQFGARSQAGDSEALFVRSGECGIHFVQLGLVVLA